MKERLTDSLRWIAFSRYRMLPAVVCLYVLPLAVLILLGIEAASAAFLWKTAVSGFVLLTIGTLIFFLLMTRLEAVRASPIGVQNSSRTLQENVLSQKNLALDEAQRSVAVLQHDLFLKEDRVRQLEGERALLQHKSEEFRASAQSEITLLREENERLQKALAEAKQTMGDQRSILEQNLERVNQLESKNDDLRYEIRTLLQVSQSALKMDLEENKTEIAPPSLARQLTKSQLHPQLTHPVRTREDAALQLQRCLDIAHKFSGSHQMAGGASRYKAFPSASSALDLRHLFEALKGEQAGALLFYSSNEGKPLFANSTVKTTLGWTPEIFIQQFSQITADGVQEWKHSLAELRTKSRTEARILMRDRANLEKTVHCLFGKIQQGLFKDHIIVVFYV